MRQAWLHKLILSTLLSQAATSQTDLNSSKHPLLLSLYPCLLILAPWEMNNPPLVSETPVAYFKIPSFRDKGLLALAWQTR